MRNRHKVPTLTSKGLFTFTESLRDVRHETPATTRFLELLASDLRAGKHIQPLPEELSKTMLKNTHHALELDTEIDGEVDL